MLTDKDCMKKYGDPVSETNLILWDVPAELEIGVIPKRLYCNKDIIQPLTKVFRLLIRTGFVDEIKTWNGCFNLRNKTKGKSPSLHSWAVAIDINAAWNGYGKVPKLSQDLVKCFDTCGFDWGGLWKIPDGMHFQIKRELII